MKRLFVPLSTDPFTWFKDGQKQWEIRKYGRQYKEKHIYIGRIVELRKGYSNPQNALWGVIRSVLIFNNVDELLKNIPFDSIIPTALNISEAIKSIRSILSIEKDSEYTLIAFKIDIIDNNNLIEISNEYIPDILASRKTTTIRRGIRYYTIGIGFLYFGNEFFMINIDSIRYCSYSELIKSDALLDGFNDIEELSKALDKFYPDLSYDDQMTIVKYTYKGI